MKYVDGWWLPDSDTYFAPYAAKGFQVDHLHAAFFHVRGWNVAVDIGAHVGFWTRDMARRFKTVLACEAAEDTFSCLRKNLAKRCPNVVLYNVGVGFKDGTCVVMDDDRRQGNTGARFVREAGNVPMMAVDSWGLLECDLVKIDVEGYEQQVLLGAAETIKKHRPVIIMETDKRFAKDRYGIPDDAAEKTLLAWGYQIAAHMRPDKIFVHVSAA